MPIAKARSIAFDILLRVATKDAFADELLHLALDQTVSAVDAGLATEIAMGVLRWQRLLDFLIDRHLTKKSKQLDIEVRIALRMGIYQLDFLERVPAHAAVNESVELARRARKSSAAPLVNAVLRKAAKERVQGPLLSDSFAAILPGGLPDAESLGIRYSHPTWLVERWLHNFGPESTRALLEWNNRAPVIAGYVLDPQNRDRAMKSFAAAGCQVTPGILLRDSFTSHGGNPGRSEAVQQGWVAIQDEASQAVAHLVAVEPGNRVLDLCAAPGGKTLLLSMAAGPKGRVIAADLYARRVEAMVERFKRSAVQNVETAILDATTPLPFEQQFDRILVDAPCSGTGTLARHPEIRWRLRIEDLADLYARQSSLLRNALTALAPGGRLVYSTCSLEPEENEQVVSQALATATGNFQIAQEQPTLARVLRSDRQAQSASNADGMFRTFPPTHKTDGFFAASIERLRSAE